MRIIVLLLVVAPVTAFAQAFPADGAYVPFHCGANPMTDAFADDPNALNERDVVGDNAHPAGLRAADATHLFLRIRLEEDPATRQFSWGMLFDTNGDRNNYEILVIADGVTGTVGLFRNTASTPANDPTDPADTPAVQTYPFAMAMRSTAAPGTTFGGSPDFFISFAVPWADLTPLGMDRGTRVYAWAASSSLPDALNGDFACHDGASGAPTLTGAASTQTTGDPAMDPGGGTGAGHLVGGEGCATSRDSSLWLVLALLPFVRRKARRLRA